MTCAGQQILLLGATGMLGSSLAPLLVSHGHVVVTHGRNGNAAYQADLTDPDATHALLESIRPGIVINLAGLTDVERCEAQPNQAYLANVRTLENISAWVRNQLGSCHLVHMSTDQVYDGPGPHEENCVTLTNYYAFSKYAGELATSGAPCTILRTNFFGRSLCRKRTSLTDWLFHSLSSGESIQVFDDVLFSPLSMSTLAEMVALVIQKKTVGIFNLGSRGGMSKADFAFAFADESGLPTTTMTRTTVDRATFLKAYRPRDMRMDCSKFEGALGIRLPALEDEIRQVAKEYS